MERVVRTMRMFTWGLALMAMLALNPASAVYTRFRGSPATYTKTFTATGLVERVRYNALIKDVWCASSRLPTISGVVSAKGSLCKIYPKRVTATAYAPQEHPAKLCRSRKRRRKAISVFFSAGEDRLGFWFMLEGPEAATGCGGLLIDWQPRR